MLANEQVVDGLCERCGAEVTKRELTQWYFRITEYAQELLDDLDVLAPTWPDRVVTAQRNWIGRSEGAHVDFVVEGRDEPLTVYTTRPGHAVRRDVHGGRGRRGAGRRAGHRRAARRRSRPTWTRSARPPRSSGWPPTGPRPASTWASHAVNPVTGEQIPVCAADYVLADYGTGAIMAVPGQDQRDWDFATRFDLPIVRTVQPPDDWEGEAYVGEGPAINSANDEIALDGMGVDEAKRTTIAWLEQQGSGPRHGQLPAARLAADAGSATGARRSRSSTARSAARCRCPRTSCRCGCRSCAAPT